MPHHIYKDDGRADDFTNDCECRPSHLRRHLEVIDEHIEILIRRELRTCQMTRSCLSAFVYQQTRSRGSQLQNTWSIGAIVKKMHAGLTRIGGQHRVGPSGRLI